jgi:GT2 family glycosyltransferase
MSGDLTIAIPTYEPDPTVFDQVLRAAAAQATRPVLVVDMSSSDSVAHAAERVANVDFVSFGQSSGVSQSRNECARRADTRYLLFLDSDAVPEPGWAEAMRRGLDRDRAAVVGARVLPPGRLPTLFDTATASDWLSFFDLGDDPRPVPRVMGTSYALDLERTGPDPFDEVLGRRPGVATGHEEVQLALDVAAAGWLCWYTADAVVRHHLAGTRLSWGWMMRRAYAAGLESVLHPPGGLDPLPRTMGWRDRAFRALVAPAFLAGRARAMRRPG